MLVRLFNPSSLQLAYALAKVQEVLWLKKSPLDDFGKNNDHNDNSLSRTIATSVLNFYLAIDRSRDGILALPSNVKAYAIQSKRVVKQGIGGT